jgi:hypothetical protein
MLHCSRRSTPIQHIRRKGSPGLRATFVFVAALLVSLASRSSQAATCTWNPPSGNSFNTVANWSCGHVPVVTDDVVFNATKTTSCTLDTSPAVLSFSINSGYTGTFTQSAAQTLTISGAFTQGAGTFVGGNSAIQSGANFNLCWWGAPSTRPAAPSPTTPAA